MARGGGVSVVRQSWLLLLIVSVSVAGKVGKAGAQPPSRTANALAAHAANAFLEQKVVTADEDDEGVLYLLSAFFINRSALQHPDENLTTVRNSY